VRPDFSSAGAKLRRAQFHLTNAQRIDGEFVDAKPYTVVIEKDSNSGLCTVRVSSVIERSNDLALVLGDAANCLRAALDHIAFACVVGNPTSREEKAIEFPICETSHQLHSTLGTLRKWLRPDAIPLIERFQPGPCPEFPDTRFLSILREVNNRDKHRAISIFYSFAKRFELSPKDAIADLEVFTGRRLEIGAVLASFKIRGVSPHKEVEVKSKTTIVPVFADGMPNITVGESAVTALVRAFNFINGTIVPEFEKLP
jgi:hypothetical protein